MGVSIDSRIATWKRIVTSNVPQYSHAINATGYRSDCSGFVSYVWGLPSKNGGVSKNDALAWAVELPDKRRLRRGDALLVIDNHIVLFDRWDGTRGGDRCIVYEMCNQCDGRRQGFRHHSVPFPFETTKRPAVANVRLLRRATSPPHAAARTITPRSRSARRRGKRTTNGRGAGRASRRGCAGRRGSAGRGSTWAPRP